MKISYHIYGHRETEHALLRNRKRSRVDFRGNLDSASDGAYDKEKTTVWGDRGDDIKKISHFLSPLFKTVPLLFNHSLIGNSCMFKR